MQKQLFSVLFLLMLGSFANSAFAQKKYIRLEISNIQSYDYGYSIPYSWAWGTQQLGDGYFQLYTDINGTTAYTGPVSVSVDINQEQDIISPFGSGTSGYNYDTAVSVTSNSQLYQSNLLVRDDYKPDNPSLYTIYVYRYTVSGTSSLSYEPIP